MATQAVLLGAAASCAAAAVGAGWGDHRRARRRDPDAVGFFDWRTVQLVAIAAGLVFIALAIRG
ncbi:hypothetical protein [Sphingomonas jeddahensis]|uniref:Uncharacterized protein n=1 Tax=Sphingomonas jeddahensis TaxID=1915074 RepID=A0A1V2EUP7_9SPHN|nr:hypothetical protein [Sphingomonas jeddahensis]ONF96396.1 hypothetical protein SPHI_16280 [Sphingomonas jeddahensis]